LIAVPWAYTLFDDMRTYFRKLVTGAVSTKPNSAPIGDEEILPVTGE